MHCTLVSQTPECCFLKLNKCAVHRGDAHRIRKSVTYHCGQIFLLLSRDHPELSELLCVEMMRRQLDSGGRAAQPQVLTCLPPWLDNLSFAARWEGTPPLPSANALCCHSKQCLHAESVSFEIT